MNRIRKLFGIFFKLFLSTEKYCCHDIRCRHSAGQHFSFVKKNALHWDPQDSDLKVLDYKCAAFCRHEFDLLGSGWRCFNRPNAFPALPPACCRYSRKLRSKISADYHLIYWEHDIKSGHHWSSVSPSYWHILTVSKLREGADIKIPWELARLQHLPQLAACAVVSSDEKAQSFYREYCNEVLDFILSNPVGTGVNWACPMDIGIRAANILLAYHIFAASEKKLEPIPEFGEILLHSMLDHADFIVRNLEYSPKQVLGNHYLSDIAGLLFVSAYLPSDKKTDSYLYFAIQELFRMVKTMFYPDGGDYESSSCYHCLCAEIVLYSSALLAGLPRERLIKLSKLSVFPGESFSSVPLLQPEEQEYKLENGRIVFPAWYADRLNGMVSFAKALTKQNQEIVQIGDNDSGHFFRLSLKGDWMTFEDAVRKYENLLELKKDERPYWDENMLDYTHLSKIGEEILGEGKADSSSLEAMVAAMLSCGNRIPFHPLPDPEPISITESQAETPELKFCLAKTLLPVSIAGNNSILYEKNGWCFVNGSITGNKTEHNLTDGLTSKFFPDSMVYVFRSPRLFLAVHAMPIVGTGGHSHNDKMNIEINIDGKDIIADPGSYCYTAHPAVRNAYRSGQAHCVALTGEEQNSMPSLFAMQTESRTILKELTETHLKLETRYRKIVHRMEVSIHPDRVILQDTANVPLQHNFHFRDVNFSNGYGKKIEQNI